MKKKLAKKATYKNYRPEKIYFKKRKIIFLKNFLRIHTRNFYSNYFNWILLFKIERIIKNFKLSKIISNQACFFFPGRDKIWLENFRFQAEFKQKEFSILILKKKFFLKKIWLQLISKEYFFFFLKMILNSLLCFSPHDFIFLNLSSCLFSIDLIIEFIKKFKNFFFKLILPCFLFFNTYKKKNLKWNFFFL
jgi:hypothetical protein